MILAPHLFPSVSWFLQASALSEVKVGFGQRFEKQSPHCRFAIAAPNKTQFLTIPVMHTGGPKELLNAEISFREKWQREHIHAIKSAYGKAPFFEFFDYKILPVLTSSEPLLAQRIKQSILVLSKYLLPEKSIVFCDDIPDEFLEKEVQPYSQVFDDRFGFRQEISAMDLLFNLGPEAPWYLMENKS